MTIKIGKMTEPEFIKKFIVSILFASKWGESASV